MPQLAVLTPSYGPDRAMFEMLHDTVLRQFPEDTVHYVVVPEKDRALFATYEGPRCVVWTEPEVLPSSYRFLGRFRRLPIWLNLRRPWWPVRGWVLQQAIKIEVAGRLDTDAVVIADSDVAFVRPVTLEALRTDGMTRLVRVPTMPSKDPHWRDLVRWHRFARRLLGLPRSNARPLVDYISSLTIWEPRIIRALQERITKVTGRSWFAEFCSKVTISEFILYGVFVDEIWAPGAVTPTEKVLSLDYWDHPALEPAKAAEFAEGLLEESIGVMVSARSATTLETRQDVLRECLRAAGTD